MGKCQTVPPAAARLQHLTDVLRAVRNVNQLITHEKDRDTLLRRACDILTETRGYSSAWIGLCDAAGRLLAAAESGIGAAFAGLRAQFERGEPPECCRRALAAPGPVVLADRLTGCRDCPLLHEFRGMAAIAVALRHGEQTYGVLVASLPPGLADDAEELALFQEVAGDLAFALHSIELAAVHRRAEEELRVSAERLRRVTRYAPCILWSGTVTGLPGWQADTSGAHLVWDIDILDEAGAQAVLPLDVPVGTTYGRVWIDSRDPGEARRRGETAAAAMIGGAEHYAQEFRCTDRHGALRWLHEDVTLRPVAPGHWLADGVLTEVTERRQGEETLRKSERKYRELVEHAKSIVLHWTRDGLVTFLNEFGQGFFGYTEAEIVGRHVVGTIVPETESTGRDLRPLMARICADPRAFERNVNENVRRNGETVWIAWANTVALDEQGQVAGILSVGTDVTDLKRAQEMLADEAVRRRILVEQSSDGIVVLDEGGKVSEANRRFAEMLGYGPDEILELHVWDWDTVWTREQLLGMVREVDATGAHFETHHRRKDGTLYDVEVSTNGAVCGGRKLVFCVCRDITERKRAEAERERLLSAIEQAAEAIVITDREGAIQYVNPAFSRVTGYSREEALGKNPRILKSGKQDEGFYRRLWDALGAGRPWEGRLVNRRKDGTLYTEEATISPVRDATGATVSYVAVKRDITHELSLEAQFLQAQKMEAVGRLAGGVAHDFNNLLMGIMNYAELCRDELPAEHVVRPWLDEIMADAQRSANLTRQLLAFARKQVIAPRVLDLNDAVAGMLKLLRRLIGEDIDLAWLPGADLWPVMLDPSQIDQILANLCVNARDAIAGVGRITIATGRVTVTASSGADHGELSPGDYVLLAVSDDGCGMDEETIGHVFEPFFTTKEMGHGTGLGLATVYGIVEQNYGSIRVESEPGKGTTLRIYLPRAEDDGPAAVAMPASPQAPRGAETVLLVEDERSLRVTCRLFLEQLGYTVLVAEAPAAALALAAEHVGEIQLLLSDVVMPGMGAKDFAAQLMAVRPHIRCLFMSGYTADVIAHRGILDQDLFFLAKPFTRDTLARKVREVLDR